MLGDDTVFDDLLLVVNVVDKQVQGGDPLGQPPLEPVPLAGPEHPRHDVEGDDAFGPLSVPVDVEGDAQPQHRAVGRELPAFEIVAGHPLQIGKQSFRFAPGPAARFE